jgi:hypothetical protein
MSILATTRDCNTPTYNMNDFILLCGTASYEEIFGFYVPVY